jgi:hypothetical protein
MKLTSIVWITLVVAGQPAIAQVESSALPKAPGVIELGGRPLDANSMPTVTLRRALPYNLRMTFP